VKRTCTLSNLTSRKGRPRDRAPKVLSAFTGAGGLDLGLESAGFHTVGCIESDASARATLRANRPGWRLLEPEDITDLARVLTPECVGLRLRELDVLVGGNPCQPFSKAAQWSSNGKTGLRDPRSYCLDGFFKLARAFLPKVILMENVPGFIRGPSAAVSMIAETLNKLNGEFGTCYELQYRVLNAVDYGVPQRRERAILVAVRDGDVFNWPEPTHCDQPVRAWDALADIVAVDAPKASGRWADLLPSIPEGMNYQWHTDRGGGKHLFGYRTRYWSFLLKLAKNEPGWTISAQPGPATGPFHWDSRPLTVRELLSLQTFPSNWKVIGEYRVQLRQIGNATPPLLAEVIGRALGEQLFGLEYERKPELAINRKRSVPQPSRARPVAPKYLDLEGKHASHPGSGRGPKPIVKREV
jgi:DNA (cytosine-5)-methyltransferase 1